MRQINPHHAAHEWSHDDQMAVLTRQNDARGGRMRNSTKQRATMHLRSPIEQAEDLDVVIPVVQECQPNWDRVRQRS